MSNGRTADLDLVLRQATRTDDAYTAGVLVGGEAGAGKSRFLEDVAYHLERDGWLVLRSTCRRNVDHDPLWPVLNAARSALGIRSIVGGPGPPSQLLDDDADPYGYARPPNLIVSDPRGTPGPVRSESAAQRIALLIDNADACDEAVAESLLSLCHESHATLPIFLVATYCTSPFRRSSGIDLLLSELPRLFHFIAHELRPLSTEETTQLVRTIDADADTMRIREIFERSEGNPFYIEALARNPRQHFPFSVEQALTRRIGALSHSATRLLHSFVVAGRDLDLDEALAAAQLGGIDEARESLQQLLDAGVLDHTPWRTYDVRHRILREFVGAGLVEDVRHRVHSALADYRLSRLTRPQGADDSASIADEWTIVADHLVAAGRSIEALNAHVTALSLTTDRASRPVDARNSLTALALWTASGDPDLTVLGKDRLWLSRQAARHLSRTGRTSDAEAMLRTELASTQLDGDATAALLAELAAVYHYSGETERSLEALSTARDKLTPGCGLAVRAEIVSRLARALALAGQVDAAMHEATSGVELGRNSGDTRVLAEAITTLGMVHTLRREAAEALRWTTQSLAVAQESCDVPSIARAYSNAVYLHVRLNALTQAKRLAEEGQDEVLRYGGDVSSCAFLRLNEAEALLLSGKLDPAYRIAASSTDGLPNRTRIYALTLKGRIAALRGDRQEALEVVGYAERLSERCCESQFHSILLLTRAQVYIDLGRYDEAVNLIEAAQRASVTLQWVHTDWRDLSCLAVRADVERWIRLAASTSRRAEIEHRLLTRVAELGEPPASVDCGTFGLESELNRIWALAEAAIVTSTSPEPIWRRGYHLATANDLPYFQAVFSWRLAECLLTRRGDRAEASSLVDEAWETAAGMGAKHIAAQIAGLASRARLAIGEPTQQRAGVTENIGDLKAMPPAAPPSTDMPVRLTSREREVLRLVAAGMSNAEIAAELFISPKTASVHVSNILRKLGVKNRVQVAVVAVRVLHGG